MNRKTDISSVDTGGGKEEELQIGKITGADSRKLSKFTQNSLYFLSEEGVKGVLRVRGNHL